MRDFIKTEEGEKIARGYLIRTKRKTKGVVIAVSVTEEMAYCYKVEGITVLNEPHNKFGVRGKDIMTVVTKKPTLKNKHLL